MNKIVTTGLAAGVAMLVVNMLIVNPIVMWLFPQFQGIYENTAIFKPMDDPLAMLFFVYPIVLGFALAWVWDKTKHLFSGNVWKNGWNFGLIYFFVAVFPVLFINMGSFNLPVAMILSWTAMSFLNGIIAGLVLAKLHQG